ncbi:MAG: phosphonate ABC transporter, permease protein PhnE [Rhodospirillales bacterium]|nr:phosphonate ABC transporter, permease protein PhnE [Rhodospirillales bacterium]HJO73680.1 phosphonate ABC transporter, permease protein PhnE [Rhodospirillales bacterium]
MNNTTLTPRDSRQIAGDDAPKREWSRFRFPGSLIRYAAWLSVFVFLAYSVEFLEIPLERLLGIFGRMGDTLANRYYPPDIEYIMEADYFEYVVETIQMAYLGALFGLVATVPLGWFASFNMTPSKRYVYPVARLMTMSCRAVHEMIFAIIFVSILGFGMLPGVLALTFFCTGFAGKLFAEEIEAIDMGPVDAMRATGANLFQIMVFGVFPQVRVAFTGIAIYTWDVAFRAATVVGFFGAGGMGWYLKRNVLQIESERVSAILLSIVVLVFISEMLSAWARNAAMKMK